MAPIQKSERKVLQEITQLYNHENLIDNKNKKRKRGEIDDEKSSKKRRHSMDHIPFKRSFSRGSSRASIKTNLSSEKSDGNIISNIRGSIRRSLRLKVHDKCQKNITKGKEDYNIPNLDNDLQYIRFICAQKKKQFIDTKENDIEQSIEKEVITRKGLINLLAASPDTDDNQQALETAKSLFLSNMKVKLLFEKLQAETVQHSPACLGKLNISGLRIPILWKDKENLKPSKYLGRNFVAFAVLKINEDILDTQMIYVTPENNNLCFDDLFTFLNVPYNFQCQLEIYCHRLGYSNLPPLINSNAANTPRKLRNKFSRISDSIGKSISKKISSMTKIEKDNNPTNISVMGPKFELIASTVICLDDATVFEKTLDLRLENIENNPVSKLQLFGHLVCRVKALPNCFSESVNVGYLSINCSQGGGWNPYFCELKALKLSCWDHRRDMNRLEANLIIPITRDTQINQLPDTSNSTLPGHCRDSLMITIGETSYEILAASNNDMKKWWNSFQQHLVDQALWKHACSEFKEQFNEACIDVEIRPVTNKQKRRSSNAPTLGVRALLHEPQSQESCDSPMTRILKRLKNDDEPKDFNDKKTSNYETGKLRKSMKKAYNIETIV